MFRAAIVGGTPQPVQFASLLTRAGHTVVATSSPDAELGEWARAQSVPHFPDLGEFGAHCARATIDYLFSVVNYRMLSPALLQIPAKLAINYHDGPLPKYAGVFVTTWALLNQETTHGVTWHVMEEKADTGDVLKQVSVPISPTETAASLNMKCYLAAARSFQTLVKELDSGTYQRTPQNLAARTYFGRQAKLQEIDASWSVEQRATYRRALDFGTGPNPFADRMPPGVAAMLAAEPDGGG